MELFSEDFIHKNSLKKLLDLDEYEQLKPMKCIQGLINENYSYTDAYVFDNEYFYTVICHCIDAELYSNDTLKKLCIEYACCHQKPSLRTTKPYFFIITKPALFNEPISEDMDLSNLFEIYGLNWEKSSKNPDLNDINIKKVADNLLRKYTDSKEIGAQNGVMVATFCDILHEHSITFYEDLLLILQKNKINEDIQHINA